MVQKWVYLFREGNKELRDLLGGKGANIAEMTNLGVPVPFGFTITTKACIYYMKNVSWPEGLEHQIREALKSLENDVRMKFGSETRGNGKTLLVSVRSGAKFSMPGMMDTILDLGINDIIVENMSHETDPRFAWDSYRRFIQMFSNVAMNIPGKLFDTALQNIKKENDVKYDFELDTEHLRRLVGVYKKIYRENLGTDFPQDPMEQLKLAITSVFKSWNNPRAIAYREHEMIPDDLGTAVNVQMMVYGNLGDDSGTGVLFTRNPSSGSDEIYGEYLVNAQGEDVVAGIRTPVPIRHLQRQFPEIYSQLYDTVKMLERHYADMQDVEFTIMDGKLFLLQTRNGKRTGVAAVKIAHDMAEEGLISQDDALLRVTPRDVENCMFPRINWISEKHGLQLVKENGDERRETLTLLGRGLAAGPGAATGYAIFDSDRAEQYKKENPTRSVILVREETSPEDFHGMVASDGILTIRGGITSHAAIVSRQIGKRCIVGAELSGLTVFEEAGVPVLASKEHSIREGEWITLDAFEGKIYSGKGAIIIPSDLPPELVKILDWADSRAKIGVRTNADKAEDTAIAMKFKAQGIGLARTEHQFFEKNRLPIVREMILANTLKERQSKLDLLIGFQRSDFENLFRAAEGKPVTIRLIDPPLHEFLPDPNKLELDLLKGEIQPSDVEAVKKLLPRLREFEEANPMMGFRGVRLSIVYPEIIVMQAKAIIEGAINVKQEGMDVLPEIMVPLLITGREFTFVREIIDKTIKEVFEQKGVVIPYKLGTMIETPRAALTAARIATRGAEFLSFGTNDLHQMTLGFSRDDVAKFLPLYIEKRLLDTDPFIEIDFKGVGRLMELCVKEAREVNPLIKIGICGEQGGDPKSIDFCYKLGMDYVSCSPFRVPVARLAAAQTSLRNSRAAA
ncbi:MAG: pyruvate, phosphate dikinase [Candidatus Heimdallarchaeota archaeon]